jgi:putative RecB family exonuclease
LQYRFRYVDEIESEIENVEAFMGNRVHEALEKLYRDLKLSKWNSLEDLLEFYNDRWERHWKDDIKVVRRDFTPENYRDTGARCISEYYNRYQPFDDARTIGLEQKVFVDIAGYKLKSVIDRLAHREDGYYEIHDYKTSQYIPPIKFLEKNRQLALYQVGVEELWGDSKRVDLIWHYLVHGKEVRFRKTEEDIQRLKAEIVSLIKRIEKATDELRFPSRESPLCDWCEFQELCPRRKHLNKTESMPKNIYLQDPGVKLVNEYARLMEERDKYLKATDAKLQKLEEAIISFAEREGVEVLRGDDKRLTVKTYYRSIFPGRGDKGRLELEEIIRSSGEWMKVSSLNLYLLARAIGRREVDSELLDKIKKYRTVEKRYRLLLSDIREKK